MQTVYFKKLTNTAHIPTQGSEDAAGWDLYADIDVVLAFAPGETIKISTGIAAALPQGTFGGVYARSGLATKKGLAPANKVGIIDADYRGEIIVALHNDSDKVQIIEPQERIAQLIIQPYIKTSFVETDTLDETIRGTGGFGSTGNK